MFIMSLKNNSLDINDYKVCEMNKMSNDYNIFLHSTIYRKIIKQTR